MPTADYLLETITCEKRFGRGEPVTKLFSRKQLDAIGQGSDGTYDGWMPQAMPTMTVTEKDEDVMVITENELIEAANALGLATNKPAPVEPLLPFIPDFQGLEDSESVPLLVDIPKLPNSDEPKTQEAPTTTAAKPRNKK